MEKKHSLSNSHVRTKVSPHVKYNKETEDVETWVTYEEIIEPIKEKAMGKVKEYYGEKYGLDNIPKIEYEPLYIPVGRDMLDPISRIIVLCDSVFAKHPGYESDREAVDKWLTEMYSKQQQNGNGIKAGNGHIAECEEDN